MILISHRGNLEGSDLNRENKIFSIRECFSLDLEVEIDVRHKDGKLYLGHDYCQEEVDLHFLEDPRLWVHCKDLESARILSSSKAHFFYHNTDDFVLTSENFFWTFPGKALCEKSIAVLPEREENWKISIAAGICTDFPLKYRKYIKSHED